MNIITSQGIPKFTSIQVFGDSTVDTGNNNHILTIAKGNHPPYGQDYPNHIPTGRFSNGKLVPDILATFLNLKKNGVPPYMQPDLPTNELLTGICFASGGTGFDELTSTISGAIPMRKQLDYFNEYLKKIRVLVGETEAQRIVNGALVIVSAGTNDFIFNFYDLPKRSLHFTLTMYQDFLLDKLQTFLKDLYDVGCRNIIVNGLPPIGCLPIQMTAKSPLAHLPGSKILYVDSYAFVLDLINNPQQHGFEETNRGCCGSGLVEAGPLCTRLSPVCSDASQYIFFDSIHPTESTYYKAADYLVKQLLPKFEKF
ncbi:hypothetical protein HAX54_039700 [Datura stramonium]|uniref:GDSL esterase/lipase n=1 Tax=Datura stramonium TaxID=4076 RepID=A0ABS8VP19_DATST|nr:hypothetical protein [Datura stramonium]